MIGKTLNPELARKYHEARTQLVATASYHQCINDALLKRLPQSRDLVVLDNMCGTGIFLEDLNARYQVVVGTDISMAMLSYTATVSNTLTASDARRLPFSDGTFDIVICRGGLHEVPELEQAFSESARILKPGGIMLIFEPCDDSIFVRFIRRLVYRFCESFDAERERGLQSAELEKLAQAHSLSVVEMRPFGVLAYVLLCNADAFPVTRLMSKVPAAVAVSRALARLDEWLAVLPGSRQICFQVIGHFVKKEPAL